VRALEPDEPGIPVAERPLRELAVIMEEARTAAQPVVNFRDEAQMRGRPLPFSDLEFDFAEGSDFENFRDGLRKTGLTE